MIMSRPDGYLAGDGEKGTGFAPYLRFDAAGRAHILFTDHGSEHFSEVGQMEYAGNIRHAWWDGSKWNFENVFRQTAPIQQQMIYPAFAMNGNELVVTGLQRATQWNVLLWPPLIASEYRYQFISKTLN